MAESRTTWPTNTPITAANLREHFKRADDALKADRWPAAWDIDITTVDQRNALQALDGFRPAHGSRNVTEIGTFERGRFFAREPGG